MNMMMCATGFTVPQLNALLALPPDGSWTTRRGRMSAAIDSLCLRHPELAQSEWADCGPRGGRKMRTRLTRSGVEVVRTLEHLAFTYKKEEGDE
jgi:hypothetical protein